MPGCDYQALNDLAPKWPTSQILTIPEPHWHLHDRTRGSLPTISDFFWKELIFPIKPYSIVVPGHHIPQYDIRALRSRRHRGMEYRIIRPGFILPRISRVRAVEASAGRENAGGTFWGACMLKVNTPCLETDRGSARLGIHGRLICRGANEARYSLKAHFLGGPGSEGGENAWGCGGIKAWSARGGGTGSTEAVASLQGKGSVQDIPRTELKAWRTQNSGGGRSRCGAQGREKRRAGALEGNIDCALLEAGQVVVPKVRGAAGRSVPNRTFEDDVLYRSGRRWCGDDLQTASGEDSRLRVQTTNHRGRRSTSFWSTWRDCRQFN
ncbi:hypothetical protein DFH09DRAFT_1273313 [Mycena vulgaris]|nr:hypothetical protein DFH09DRAFT_1273313 [Mycena vulgaris]